MDFNRKVVKYWLDNLKVDRYIKLYKNKEVHFEVAYLVIDYFGDEDNSDYPQFIYQKLGIKLSDKKRMFEEFGWDNIRKASKIANLYQQFFFSRMSKNINFTKKALVEYSYNKEIFQQDTQIKKTIDGVENELSLEDYTILLLQDLKNLEEIMRSPLSKWAYDEYSKKEFIRYIEYSLITLIIIIESNKYEKYKLFVFLLSYFELDISIEQKNYSVLEFLISASQSVVGDNIKSYLFYSILKLLIECYENNGNLNTIKHLWFNPQLLVRILGIIQAESEKANLVVLKYAVYDKELKCSTSTKYRRLLGVEDREKWLNRQYSYRLNQGMKIFKEINCKNIQLRGGGKNKIKFKKNGSINAISKDKLQTKQSIDIRSRPVLYKSLYEYYISEYNKVYKKLKKKNKDNLENLSENELQEKVLLLVSEKLSYIIEHH